MNHEISDIEQQSMRLKELLAYKESSRILARWEPVRYMDSGTFSHIFLVRNRQTGTYAVLKFIPNPMDLLACREEGSQEDLFYQTRFAAARREAEIMGRFRGETHVVQYLEEPEYLKRSFVNARMETVRQYAVLICMPLYKNHREWLPLIADDRNARLRLGIEISEALIAFEEKGVYHRDIKPGNILMDNEGHFCLSDVGEAKLESEFTTTGFHGTRPYMAPEVYNQENERKKMHSDHRSDIYSLGIILYRLFNRGQFPFLKEGGELTVDARTNFKSYSKKYGSEVNDKYLTDGERARLLRYDGAKLPPPCEADAQLGKVILRACAYRKEDRYATAAALREDLRCCMEGRTIRLRKKNSRMALVAGGCLLAAAIVGGMVYFISRQGKQPGVDAMPTPSPVYTIVPSVTEIPTAAPMPTLTLTASPIPTPIPTPTPTPTPSPTPSLTPTPTPSPSPTPTPSPVPTATPSPAPTANQEPAGPFTWDNYEANDLGDGTCEIVGYTGTELNLEIPQMLAGRKVIGIGDEAFRSSKLTSLTIPEGVEYIGENALAYCYELTKMNIPNSLTVIGEGCLRGNPKEMEICIDQEHPTLYIQNGLLIDRKTQTLLICLEEKEEIIVPAGVVHIGDSAFINRKEIRRVVLPNSVKTIGYFAFRLCSSIQEIIIPEGVTEIGAIAFGGCDSLEKLEIPDSVVRIGEHAFDSESLKEIVISPNHPALESKNDLLIDKAGQRVIAYTGEASSVTIPAGIKEIGSYVFFSNDSLKNINFPQSLESIGYNAFAFCDGLTRVNLPDSVKTIDNGAFHYCRNLSSISIPLHLEHVGSEAFAECDSLKNLIIDALNTRYTYEDGFLIDKRDDKLVLYTGSDAEVRIPENVKIIGESALQGNDSVRRVYIPGTVKQIMNHAFADCDDLSSVVISEGVEVIGSYVFDSYGSDYLTEITFPSSVKSIGTLLFCGRDKLTTLEIRSSSVVIDEDIFAYCDGIKTIVGVAGSESEQLAQRLELEFIALDSTTTEPIVMPISFTWGEYQANDFGNGTCEITDYTGNEEDLIIPEELNGRRVVRLAAKAFQNKSAMKSVTIPVSVTCIRSDAFEDCSELKTIAIPNKDVILEDCFLSRCWALRKIYGYPGSSAEKYASANNVDFVSIEAMPTPTPTPTITPTPAPTPMPTKIPMLLKALDAKKSVSGDYEYADMGDGTCVITDWNGNKSNLKIPNQLNGKKVVGIGYEAFTEYNRWPTVSSVTIPEGITVIGQHSFYYCENLKQVTIPESVTTIERCAFDSCMALESVTIPKNVTLVGENAFRGCYNLTSITVDSANVVFEYDLFNRGVFEQCDRLEEIRGIPGSSAETLAKELGVRFVALSDEYLKALNEYEKGDDGDEVLRIKERLQELGYYSESAEFDSVFNEIMVNRVKQYQRDHGLEQTGRVDEETYRSLMLIN